MLKRILKIWQPTASPRQAPELQWKCAFSKTELVEQIYDVDDVSRAWRTVEVWKRTNDEARSLEIRFIASITSQRVERRSSNKSPCKGKLQKAPTSESVSRVAMRKSISQSSTTQRIRTIVVLWCLLFSLNLQVRDSWINYKLFVSLSSLSFIFRFVSLTLT